jgi:hypothetical protein
MNLEDDWLKLEKEARRFLNFAWEQFTQHSDTPGGAAAGETVGTLLCRFSQWLTEEETAFRRYLTEEETAFRR